ncbi:hypothetical protein FPCIR_680 [Fusarium pseudocircinatum]|uniref:Uncharacterized protein n=1 Tax=Fusarium pseudocircinatum TaxID=56676 RepID=A0A8H5PXH3_9HYPO|nr:hypothetical protein FPCIR_680 [Fusarium pseudocircinatum]
MSNEEQSSSPSQTTPPDSSEVSSEHMSPPPYESAMPSREPMPEPVHVIVEPLEMPLDTKPEEAKPWLARNRRRIRIVFYLVFVPTLAVLALLFL